MSQTRSRPLGFGSHMCRRCAGQPCLLHCRIILLGKPQSTAALATPQESRRFAGLAGKSLVEQGSGPSCVSSCPNGYEICIHLQFLFSYWLAYIFSAHMQSFVYKPCSCEAHGHWGGTICFLTHFFWDTHYQCVQIHRYQCVQIHTI